MTGVADAAAYCVGARFHTGESYSGLHILAEPTAQVPQDSCGGKTYALRIVSTGFAGHVASRASRRANFRRHHPPQPKWHGVFHVEVAAARQHSSTANARTGPNKPPSNCAADNVLLRGCPKRLAKLAVALRSLYAVGCGLPPRRAERGRSPQRGELEFAESTAGE
jgi:hypothetical protein